MFTPTPTSAPCSATPLSVAPVRLENIRNLNPVGSLVPPDHVFPTPHMYFYVKNDSTPGEIESPVFAPADIQVTSITYRHYDRIGQKTDYTDYSITFDVCDRLAMYFHHVRSLTHPALLPFHATACIPQGPGNEKACQIQARATIKTGEQIGTTGDTVAGVGGLDMGARDYRLSTGRSAFANPDRWCNATGSQSIYDHCYTVCPLDYLPVAVRSPYLGLFKDFTQTVTRTEEPRCGTAYSDVPGSAQGRWFIPGGMRFSEGPNLYLGFSAFTSQIGEFSMGTSVPGIRPGAHLYQPRDTGLVNRRFREITDGQVYCFEGLFSRESDPQNRQNLFPENAILLQLAEGGQSVRIEPRQGATCGAAPWPITAAAVTFQR